MTIYIRMMAVVLLLSSIAGAADLEMSVSANRDSIYIGESFLLSVKVSGLDSPQIQPDLSAITNCSVKLLDNRSDSHYSVVIVNGKVTRSGFSGRVFTYEITPASVGTCKAGPVNLAVNGRTLTQDGPSVTITGIEKQDSVAIEVKSSGESVLIDEPFEISLCMTLKRLPGQYADIDPLDPQNPPSLTIPFLEDSPIQGLDTPDIRNIINERLVRRNDAPGFAVNNYTYQGDPFGSNNMFDFGSFMQPKKARFIFDKTVIQKDGASFFQYRLKLKYTPREEGSHTFGPVVFKGPLIIGVTAESRPITRQIFAVGPACTVRVVPPPEQGRPSSFIGAIGSNLTVEASLDTQTCKVGDPLTLTLTASGNINMNSIYPPQITTQTNLAKNFRIYEDSVQTSSKEDKKVFAYTIRPTVSGTFELPPVEISYYDSNKRAYRTITTQPLPIRVNEALEVGVANIIEAVTNNAAQLAKRTAESNSTIPAPIDMNPAGAEPDTLGMTSAETLLLAGSPVAYLIVALLMFLRRNISGWTSAAKRQNALNKAISLINNANAFSKRDTLKSSSMLCAAVRHYLANRFQTVGPGLTPGDAGQLLAKNGIPANIANKLYDILERNFNSAYSSTAGAPTLIERDCAETIALLREIEASIKQSSSRKQTSSLSLLSWLCLSVFFQVALPNCFAETTTEHKFIWNEANARMGSATTPDEFLAAAATYRKLIDSGICNSALFFNMGTALLKAKQPDAAIDAFLRAERYPWNNEDIRRNMLIAFREKTRDTSASLPWYRAPLFWHYGLPVSTRIFAAVCAFAGFWAALILRALGSTRIYKPILATALILLILFGSSAATSLLTEYKAQRSQTKLTYTTALPPAAETHSSAAKTKDGNTGK